MKEQRMDKYLYGTSASKRIKWIDYAKGIGIFLVVFGHIVDGILQSGFYVEYSSALQYIKASIYSFHMELFFILSGYVYYHVYLKENKIKKNKEQIINLIFVYFIFSMLLWLFKRIFSGNVVYSVSYKDLFMIPFKPIGAYWYLYVLIVFYIVCMIRLKNEKYYIYLFCGSLVANILVCKLNEHIDMGILYKIIYYLPYFLLGFIFCMQKKPKVSLYITMGLGMKVIAMGACYINIFEIIAKSINAIGISMVIIGICMYFEKKIINLGIIEKWGKRSMYIYMLHIYVVGIYKSIFSKVQINIVTYIVLGTILGFTLPMAYFKLEQKLGISFFSPYKIIKKEE